MTVMLKFTELTTYIVLVQKYFNFMLCFLSVDYSFPGTRFGPHGNIFLCKFSNNIT